MVVQGRVASRRMSGCGREKEDSKAGRSGTHLTRLPSATPTRMEHRERFPYHLAPRRSRSGEPMHFETTLKAKIRKPKINVAILLNMFCLDHVIRDLNY